MGTLGNFFSNLGDILGETISELAEQYQEQKDREEKAAEEEFLETMETARDTLQVFLDLSSQWLEDYDDLETYDDVLEIILGAAAFSCLLNGDLDTCQETFQLEENEAMEEFAQGMEVFVDLLDEFYDPDIDDGEPLSKTFSRFNKNMMPIVKEIETDLDDEDFDDLDWENYYKRTQRAINTYRKKLKVFVKSLTEQIENEYDEDDNYGEVGDYEPSTPEEQYAYATIVQDLDEEEAFRYYLKAAQQGHIEAQYKLGECYYYGNGTAEDDKEAVKWYMKAAKKGYADAQFELGECYELGLGVEENEAQAIYWYKKAASQGHEEAIEALENL